MSKIEYLRPYYENKVFKVKEYPSSKHPGENIAIVFDKSQPDGLGVVCVGRAYIATEEEFLNQKSKSKFQ